MLAELKPASNAELLSIYNPLSIQNVALAGYNTGVDHFGWSFPGRTVVKTVGAGRVMRMRGESLVVDAGVTLKRTIEFLSHAGRELLVVPNYSYIGMGTAF